MPLNKQAKKISVYTDPILVFFGTEIAYAPKQFFSALLRGFSGPKRMIFHFQPVRQKSCRIKPKLFQYIQKIRFFRKNRIFLNTL